MSSMTPPLVNIMTRSIICLDISSRTRFRFWRSVDLTGNQTELVKEITR